MEVRIKIVLTGGPSAGKTSIVDILNRSDKQRTQVVQEAASLLYRGGFPRSSEPVHLQCQQRAIFHVQIELEEIGAFEGKNRTLICDRGTLDGLAYWPDSEESFFAAIGSTMTAEVGRYDWVIHLDTTVGKNYETTSVRMEKLEEATLINNRVKSAWRLHPNRIFIGDELEFIHKANKTLLALTMITERRSSQEIQLALGSPI